MNHPKFRHVERQARRMHEMMDYLDVDAGKLVRLDQGRLYAEARARCLDCSQTTKCLNWLELFDAFAEPPSPDFCVNFELFQACKRSRAG